ncbi:hypothetical protein D4Q80_02565 [bacterium]|nr:MAG: hypothetical protein D4Q80_02565 [bacterium]
MFNSCIFRAAMPLLFIICFVIYLPSLGNSFVFDDIAVIVNNPFIKSLKFLPNIFTHNLYYHLIANTPGSFMYRPLQAFTYAIDYKVWGLNPFGFHLVNVILHFINGLLVYYFLLLLFQDNKISLFSSILFLIHPIQASAVAYISGRADLLSFLFMILSAATFLKFIQARFIKLYFFSLLCAACALLSRENALSIFMLIALIIFVQKQKVATYLLLIPFILLNLFYLLLRLFIFGYNDLAVPGHRLSFMLRTINFLNIIPRYILLLLFPHSLRMFHVTPFVENIFWVPLIFILLCILTAIRFRNNRLVIFSLLWFIITIVPVFFCLDGFLHFGGAMMAENWAYPAILGFSALLFYLLSLFKKYGRPTMIFLVILLGISTIINNKYWNNEINLYKRILEFCAERNILRANLIDAYLRSGQSAEALKQIKELEKFYPESPLLYLSWGDYFFYTGNPEAALKYYNRILIKSFLTSHKVSSCYMRLGQFDKAMGFALASYRSNPYFEPNCVQLEELKIKCKMKK